MEKNVKYVWAKQNVVLENRFNGIVKGKKYRVYSEFETDKVASGRCFVIIDEKNHFTGFDSGYFISEEEYESIKFNGSKYNV